MALVRPVVGGGPPDRCGAPSTVTGDPRPAVTGDPTPGLAPPGLPELTTVAEDEVVFHAGMEVRRYAELAPATTYTFDGALVRTLERPGGELLATVATVNDVHFGETECGVIEGLDLGPILRSEPDEPPYPETMNAGAAAEIAALSDGRGPDAVVAKGDLTTHGAPFEYERFLAVYEGTFGSRLYQVRGNHDAYQGQTLASDAPIEVALDGVTLAVLDTVIPTRTTGQISSDQLDWLDELGQRAGRDRRAVLVFGHHHCWDPSSPSRPADYFGISPDDSEALVEVFTRRLALMGYFAGHTHRNRVRHFAATAGLPWVEVASVKDYPGSWAEYRVYEGGVVQIHRRVSSPEALRWTERTRAMFGGAYPGYAFGTLEDRCFVIPLRS